MMSVLGAVLWYLAVRFLWQKDLAFFHAGVPRIGAGIIVGYLPVFLIDEVWDLARRPWFPLGVTVALMGTTTLLYLYVEVKSRIRDPREAFARARRLFLLGVLQAEAFGLILTSLLGAFMVSRTWGDEGMIPIAELRAVTPHLHRRAAAHHGHRTLLRLSDRGPADDLLLALRRHLPAAALGRSADHGAALGPSGMG